MESQICVQFIGANFPLPWDSPLNIYSNHIFYSQTAMSESLTLQATSHIPIFVIRN